MVTLAALLSSLSLLLGGGASTHVQKELAPAPLVTLSVSGRGWGHGVGMSQWGAYGYAQRGSAYGEILAHFYRGTEVGKVAATPMRVLVVEQATRIAIASPAPFAVKDVDGESHDLAAGSYSFGNGLRLKVDQDGPARQLTGPLLFTAGAAQLALNGKRYRGTVEVAVEKGRLRAVNTVGLEAYLAGVVPSEVPFAWPAEALKAQAVAARSYALATRKPGGAFDVYADVRSQVYGGVDVEHAETTAAVQATAGQVVLYQGKVATTYFFSTSGGKTADIAEAWPGSPPVPYLVSVPDPYDTASPYHRWGPVSVGPRKLKRALSLSALPVDAKVSAGSSGRVSEVVLTLADGAESTVPAGTVRTALGLRSTWFRFGLLGLEPPEATPLTFGARTRLRGVVRGLSSVTLERRPLGEKWEKVANVKTTRGVFAVRVKGQETADYRLAAAKLRGAPVRLVVAPRLGLAAGEAPGTFVGSVRPAFPGATVVIQRLDGSRWARVGKAVVDDAGSYSAELGLPPGTYRARLAPRGGYALAFSPALVVTS